MEEIWKDIECFEGIYQVSNIGRVKSLTRTRLTRNRWGQVLEMPVREKILKPALRVGYPFVVLSNAYGKKNISIHRLVAGAFLPRIKGKNIVNHKNGIKTDNRVENLEWATQKENRKHARDTGLESLYGSGNGNSKLTEENVKEIKSELIDGEKTHREIAERYNVDRSLITAISNGKTWRHV